MRCVLLAFLAVAAVAVPAAGQAKAEARVSLTVGAPAVLPAPVAVSEPGRVALAVPEGRLWRMVERGARGPRELGRGRGGAGVVLEVRAGDRPREVTVTVWTL